jgi:hypothetical protein
MADKDLAEFVIHLALENDNAASFKSALSSNGALFPTAFAERLHEMVARPPRILIFCSCTHSNILLLHAFEYFFSYFNLTFFQRYTA